jgi:uncharacterized surface protein with fasciclin (FAS1) repeats
MFSSTTKTARVFLSSLAVITITAGLTSGCSKDAPKSAGRELKIVPGVLPAVAKQIPLASTFSDFLAVSPLLATTSTTTKLTIFVPTNQAISDYLSAKGITKEAMIADAVLLQAFVGAHVSNGEVSATNLLNRVGESITMLNGSSLVIGKSKEGQVTLKNISMTEGTLIAIDVPATNGLLQLVDKVLAS